MGFQTGVCLSREAVAGKGTTEETLILALIFSSDFKTKGCLLLKGFSQKKKNERNNLFLLTHNLFLWHGVQYWATFSSVRILLSLSERNLFHF